MNCNKMEVKTFFRQSAYILSFFLFLFFPVHFSIAADAEPAMVKDIYPGADSSYPLSLVNVNGTIYFEANDGTSGAELWKSDGTESGTVLVKDIYPGAESSYPSSLVNVDGIIYFNAGEGTHGFELWKSDGTESGTVLVKDIYPGAESSYPSSLVNADSTIYFEADDGTSGAELWKSDGTELGTVLVKDIYPGANGSFPFSFINVNGTIYFEADDGTHGLELWKSDGTEGGTAMVKDINPGADGSDTSNLVNINGTIYFYASDGTNGFEFWKSDGTEGGTAMVKDINPGAADSFPSSFVNADSTIYFNATDAAHGAELWKLETAVSDVSAVAKARIDSWNYSLFTDQSSCPQKLKLTIKGKHFDDGAKVKIGGKEASSVNVKNSKKIVAKFCLEKLLNNKLGTKHTVSVKNPDTDTEKADEKINLSVIINGDFDPNTVAGIKNIQTALIKLGYLDQQYITGIYGPITTAAVQKFQGDNGIPQTGFVGPMTKAKLEEKTKN